MGCVIIITILAIVKTITNIKIKPQELIAGFDLARFCPVTAPMEIILNMQR
jgi:hypothetical protein